MPISEQMIYATAALTCAAVAVVCDVRERRIPNWLTGPALVLGLGLHAVLGGMAQCGWALLAAVIAGGIFLVFYAAGGMGAGDVKLMAALAAIVGPSHVAVLLIATVIAGGVFAVGFALYRGALRRTLGNVVAIAVHHRTNGFAEHPELNVRNDAALRLPYALPIAVGCVFAMGASLLARMPR